MSSAPATHADAARTAKALVLLGEQRYLEEYLGEPFRYFLELTKQGILSQDDCAAIRSLPDRLRIQRFLELVSASEKGYDVLVRALRKQQHLKVAKYLQKKVKEMESKLAEEGETFVTN